MGFFETFWTWLNIQLVGYIGDNAARVATVLEPAIITLATLYVMVWGFLQMTGRTDEAFVAGLKRIVTLAVVLGVALRLWLYNAVVVDTFYEAPTQLAAAIVGSSDPVRAVDAIWEQGGAVAGYLWSKGNYFSSSIGFYLAGAAVWALIGLLCIYTMFLIALSRIGLSVLLALGPLFIAMTLFNSTRRFFEAWVAQLANYALISILTVLTAALLLRIVQSYAAQTAALGDALRTVDSLNMALVSALVFLFMRQVMPIAASLSSGAALTTFSTMSRAVAWGMHKGAGWARSSLSTATAIVTGRAE